VARPEDGDELEATHTADGTLREVHPREPVYQDRHRLGRRGTGGRRHREQGPTHGQLGRAAPVGEEPEVPNADEAAREDVEEEPPEELVG